MENLITDDPLIHKKIKAHIRLDFKGMAKPGKLFFGGKSTEKVAEEMREHQVAIFRNVPIQGITIEDIDLTVDIYEVYDEINQIVVSYAPVILSIVADTLQDVMSFIARDDFRKIEIIEPSGIQMSKYDIERLLFRVAEEMRDYRQFLDRKYSRR